MCATWLWFQWMVGNEWLPGRGPGAFGGEWRSGAEPLWLYEDVRRAQRETATSYPLGAEPPEWVEALQRLVDAVSEMEAAGMPAGDLIGPTNGGRMRAIRRHQITPTRARRVAVGASAHGGDQ